VVSTGSTPVHIVQTRARAKFAGSMARPDASTCPLISRQESARCAQPMGQAAQVWSMHFLYHGPTHPTHTFLLGNNKRLGQAPWPTAASNTQHHHATKTTKNACRTPATHFILTTVSLCCILSSLVLPHDPIGCSLPDVLWLHVQHTLHRAICKAAQSMRSTHVLDVPCAFHFGMICGEC
jgi:hypothetical protein